MLFKLCDLLVVLIVHEGLFIDHSRGSFWNGIVCDRRSLKLPFRVSVSQESLALLCISRSNHCGIRLLCLDFRSVDNHELSVLEHFYLVLGEPLFELLQFL